jgi:endo-1,4-beta-mannosidase
LHGHPFRFAGINVYNANSTGQCAPQLHLETDLSSIGAGQQVLRAWFFQPLATVQGHRDWTAFDHTLAVARAHNVRMVFVLANQWNYCDGATNRDLAWYQHGYATQVDAGSAVPYRQWVQEAVTRYSGNSTVAFWQLVNEGEARNPDGTCNETAAAAALRAFADDIGGLTKSTDPNHLVSLGTTAGECGSNITNYQYIYAAPAIDICDYHDYGSPFTPMPGDQWNGLQVSLDRCRADGKPMFVGEMGIHSDAVGGIAQRSLLLDQKFAAQFAAGIVGELMWTWAPYPNHSFDYIIAPGDPALSLLPR